MLGPAAAQEKVKLVDDIRVVLFRSRTLGNANNGSMEHGVIKIAAADYPES
jgi:hypothetical protein